jgi:hypothetical protein
MFSLISIGLSPKVINNPSEFGCGGWYKLRLATSDDSRSLFKVHSSKEYGWLVSIQEVGIEMEIGTWTGGSNGSLVRGTDAIQHLDICAKLVSIIGRRICGDGSGCSIIC